MNLTVKICLAFFVAIAVLAQNKFFFLQYVNEKKTCNLDFYPSRKNGKEILIDRIDPVIYQSWTPKAPISRDEYVYFDTNGFLMIKDFFDKDQVEQLNQESKRLQEISNELIGVVNEMNTSFIRNIWQLADQSSIFGKMSQNKKLLSIISYLLNDKVYLHQSKLVPKKAFHGKSFQWHSDFEIWHTEDGMPRMRAIAVMVFLKDNTHINGPIMYIPQSHKTFISVAGVMSKNYNIHSATQQDTYIKYSNDIIKRMVDDYGTFIAVGDAGSVVLFDPNLLHASNGNLSPYDRTNALLVYNSINNQLQSPFSTGKMRPEFMARRKNVIALSSIE